MLLLLQPIMIQGNGHILVRGFVLVQVNWNKSYLLTELCKPSCFTQTYKILPLRGGGKVVTVPFPTESRSNC
jgi:hypothetical protein